MEGINPEDIIDMHITKDGLILLYKSVCFHLDKVVIIGNLGSKKHFN